MTVLSVVGARPNFMKLAPVARALEARGVGHVIVHTGQHYDRSMSDQFFEDLGIPDPDVNLEVGSGSHARQTAAIMERFEPVVLEHAPETVLVYGDVNSTVAAALVAAKLGIRVGHVEAGLRSRDWGMPEEINRVVTDRLSDLLFAPSPDGVENLRQEGVPDDRIHFVGNVMIDTVSHVLPRARALDAPGRFGVDPQQYAVVTLHRPSNVDDRDTLRRLLAALDEIGSRLPVLFAVHPRTRDRMQEFGLSVANRAVQLVDPIPYLDMLGLVDQARVVVTDSGGLQEETSFLGVPCVTVRPNTERPITCTEGTNELVGPDTVRVLAAVDRALSDRRSARPIDRWDGRAGERIVDVLEGVRSYHGVAA